MIGNIRGKNHKFTKNTVSKQKYLRQKNKYCTRTINQQDGVRCLDIYSVKNVKIQPKNVENTVYICMYRTVYCYCKVKFLIMIYKTNSKIKEIQ